MDEIWSGDLFDREAEAVNLQAYIEDVARVPETREGALAYTIAVDAPYGEGKSYFLKRLAKQLQRNHPVAFVDAWADDLADEPLTALAATLKEAITPVLGRPEVRSRWDKVLDKSGKIAAIAAKGLLKKGLSTVFTAAAVDLADHVLANTKYVHETLTEVAKGSGKDAVEESAAAIQKVAKPSAMEARIAEFEEGRAAIRELKDSLGTLVETLKETDLRPPVVIIIDELDRCRPTYAVKLLEEVKHLFEVPGLIFVLGMHRGQLAHSVTGAYGAGFEGSAYLRRFISFTYTLRTPDQAPLIEELLAGRGVAPDRLFFPRVTGDNSGRRWTPAQIISVYMSAYGLAARDAFRLVDSLRTCAALTQGAQLIGGYLLPLVCCHLQGLGSGKMMPPPHGFGTFTYWYSGGRDANRERTIDPWAFATKLEAAAQADDQALYRMENWEASIVQHANAGEANRLASPRCYPELTKSVGRFTNNSVN